MSVTKPSNVNRRSFIMKMVCASAGAAGAIAVPVGARSATGLLSEADTPQRNLAGYRETDHVKTYYALARR